MSKKFDRDALLALPHKDVKARYQATFGEPPRSPNKTWMVNQLQEEHERRKAASKAAKAEAEAAAPAAARRRGRMAAETEEPEPEAETEVSATESAPLAEEEPVAPAVPEPARSRKRRRGATRDEGVAQEPATLPEPAEDEESASSPSTDAEETEPSEGTEESIAATATSDVLSSSRFERGRFKSMTIEELRTRYEQVLGRATSSVDRSYLTWKIMRAEKGRIRVGPVVAGKRLEGSLAGEDKTLPLTLTAAAVVAMDAAWRRLGFTSRMKFMRAAIRQELERGGETNAADLFGEKGAA
jgi:hypothetical protein